MFDFLKRNNTDVIHVNELDDLIGKIDLIDIREPYEYASGSIKSAKNIPMSKLLGDMGKYLNKEKTYYIMCQSGGRSRSAAKMLTNQGYHVIDVAGGMGSYVGTKRK